MNILLLTNKMPYPPWDGGSIATLNMATGLAAAGAKVSLLAINTSKHYFSQQQIPDWLKQQVRITWVDVDTRIKTGRLIFNLLFSRLPYNAQRFVSGDVLKELEQLVDSGSFDAVQLEGPYMDYCIPLIRKKTDCLIALRAHNLEHEIWTRSARRERNPVKRWYLKVLARRIRNMELNLLGRIDLLIPISSRDHEQFLRLGSGCPVHTATVGLNPADYPVKAPPPQLDLFFIGAMDWRPNAEGLDWFIERVWPAVKSTFPGMDLYIAGRNTGKYYRKKSGDPGIHLLGEIEDARRFMSEHAVMIVPLWSGSGIRIKILEGMAQGKTIITTRIGLEGIEAKNGQEIFVAEGPEQFIEVLETLHQDPSTLEAIAGNSRRFITENFDNLAICRRLLAFYKEQL